MQSNQLYIFLSFISNAVVMEKLIIFIVNVKKQYSWDFYCGKSNKKYNLKDSPLHNPYNITREKDRDSKLELFKQYADKEFSDPLSDFSQEIDLLVDHLLLNGSLVLGCLDVPKKSHVEYIAELCIKRVWQNCSNEDALQDLKIEIQIQSPQKQGKRSSKPKETPVSQDYANRFNHDTCQACDHCPLHISRTNTVWSRGSGKKRLLIVGEAPGQNEDETGLPFIGASGKMLEKMLASIGLDSQEDCWIVNACKCRPPDNRKPTAGETDACFPYLQRQIIELQPKVILAVGDTSTKRLIGKNDFKISNCRGKVFPLHLAKWNLPEEEEWQYLYDIKVIPTFHPAYLLRNPEKEVGSIKWQTWQDMILLKEIL